MLTFLRKIARNTKGATAVEYGLILALIFIAMVSGVMALGNSTKDTWSNINSKVANAR